MRLTKAQNQNNFKKKYTFQERVQKSKQQLAANPGKIVIIVQRDNKCNLPTISNPRFLCQKDQKFSAVKLMLQKKVKQSMKLDPNGKNSFFLFVKGIIPNQQTTMNQIYSKYKDEDGFLYLRYTDQQTL